MAAIKASRKNLQVFNPAKLEADELSQEFCGACHVSFEKALLMPKQGGENNLRYQPYRIFNSRGHSGDARISCVACHDPHDKLAGDAASYDSKCLACHLTTRDQVKTAERSAAACPVSRQKCTTCHMPKIELPGATSSSPITGSASSSLAKPHPTELVYGLKALRELPSS